MAISSAQGSIDHLCATIQMLHLQQGRGPMSISKTIKLKLKSWTIQAKRAVGSYSYLHTEDRRILEDVVFPYFVQRAEYAKVLFVGTSWYTEGYKLVFKSKDYRTLEVDPRQARHGSSGHIIDRLENIHLHFKPGELDLIFCNGVYGYGLNDKLDAERAFAGCFSSLREGGVLVLGWNDVPARRPFPLEACQALLAFEPLAFAPLSASRYLTSTDNRHTFNFYVKAAMDKQGLEGRAGRGS